MTSTTKHSFDLQAARVIDVLGLFFNMISIGVCTTRDCQTPGRLVQELDTCTVYIVLVGSDPEEQLRCARSWSNWEMRSSRLIMSEDDLKMTDSDQWALQFARLEWYDFNVEMSPDASLYLCIEHTHRCIHTHIHTYIHACLHASMHTYILTYICTCMNACIYTYIYTYIHAYIHTYIHKDDQ